MGLLVPKPRPRAITIRCAALVIALAALGMGAAGSTSAAQVNPCFLSNAQVGVVSGPVKHSRHGNSCYYLLAYSTNVTEFVVSVGAKRPVSKKTTGPYIKAVNLKGFGRPVLFVESLPLSWIEFDTASHQYRLYLYHAPIPLPKRALELVEQLTSFAIVKAT